MIEKRCTICGKTFKVYPCEKERQCCSRKCGAALRARHGKTGGSAWSDEAKRRRAADKTVRDRMEKLQPIGVKAAMNIPGGQKGPQNRESLVWILVDPAGVFHKAVNLLDWARKNKGLFFSEDVPEEIATMRISYGFRAIAATMRGGRKNSRPAMTYKGWTLSGLPTVKKPEDNEHNNKIL